ncbi:hypothetical protein VP424E501_P0137 [Vibrio phage 424E50-1]|nr:hypothetical protein VP424E501_P0137 [Vibrio phage 424E50-1]
MQASIKMTRTVKTNKSNRKPKEDNGYRSEREKEHDRSNNSFKRNHELHSVVGA